MNKRVLLITMLIIAIIFTGCGSSSSNTSAESRRIASELKGAGVPVRGMIDSDHDDKYYCYIDGNVSVVDVSKNEILIKVYNDNNQLIDYYTVDR